jgi:Carboxypeptidase regulatory-like domain
MQRQIAILSGFLCAAVLIYAQEPTPPPGEAPQQSSPAAGAVKPESTSSEKKKKNIPAFVIIGTVFNENAISYPNVRVQVRRESEKKFKWDTYTNSRGEFSVRVPEGQEYEVVVREKKYKDISLKVNASNGDVQKRLSIRLEKIDAEKDSAKK